MGKGGNGVEVGCQTPPKAEWFGGAWRVKSIQCSEPLGGRLDGKGAGEWRCDGDACVFLLSRGVGGLLNTPNMVG